MIDIEQRKPETSLIFSAEIGELVKARAATVLPPIPKRRAVKVKTKAGGEYSYMYAELCDILEACTGPLAANGLVVFQGPWASRTDREICVFTLLAHVSGQWIKSFTYLQIAGAEAKDSGSAITYARRYGYQSITGIAPEDDDDGQTRVNSRADAIAQEMRERPQRQAPPRSAPAPKPKDARPFEERMRDAKSFPELRSIAKEIEEDKGVQANPDRRTLLLDCYHEEKKRLEAKQAPPARQPGVD